MSQPQPTCSTCARSLCLDSEGNVCDAVVKNRGRCNENGGPQVIVCICCNRLSARVYKITSQNKDLKIKFGAIGGEYKKQWMQQHADFHGVTSIKQSPTRRPYLCQTSRSITSSPTASGSTRKTYTINTKQACTAGRDQ